MNWQIIIIVVCVVFVSILFSLYFEKPRNWWKNTVLEFVKTSPGKIWRIICRNWNDDHVEFETRIEKQNGVNRRVFVLDDNDQKIPKTTIKGRKHNIVKNISMFFLAVFVVLVFAGFFNVLFGSIVFQAIFICLTLFFLWKGRKNDSVIAKVFLMFLAMGVVFYPLFKGSFFWAMILLLGIAFLVFLSEELFDRGGKGDWYPRLVTKIGLGILVIAFGLTIVDCFRPVSDFSGYVTFEKVFQEKVEQSRLQSTLRHFDKHGFKSLSENAQKYLSVKLKNQFSSNRLSAVLGKLFFTIYFFLFYFVFMIVASYEIIGGIIENAKKKMASGSSMTDLSLGALGSTILGVLQTKKEGAKEKKSSSHKSAKNTRRKS